MEANSSRFDGICRARFNEAWHAMQPQQLQQPQAAAASAIDCAMAADWRLSTACWLQQHQQQHQHQHQEHQHYQHQHHQPLSISLPPGDAAPLDPQAMAEAAAEVRWRQLPVSLRRRASAQAATALLKAWMRSHSDNPYPSKREKSALAALTNMSFAQISTWFANARRRLKKDSVGGGGGSGPSASGAAPSSSSSAIIAAGSAAASSGVSPCDRDSIKKPPRIWSLVETALNSKDDAYAAAAATENCGGAGANVREKPVVTRSAVTPEDVYCWQLCQGYISGL